MTGSRIVAVRSGLIEALAPVINAVVGMEDVAVGFQYPTGNDELRDIVWTQSGRLAFSPASMKSGPNFLNESSGFDLMFRSSAPNVAPEEIAQRVVDIAEVAVDWINANKNGSALAVTGLNWVLVNGDGIAEEFPTDSGYGAGIRIPITFSARLTQ